MESEENCPIILNPEELIKFSQNNVSITIKETSNDNIIYTLEIGELYLTNKRVFWINRTEQKCFEMSYIDMYFYGTNSTDLICFLKSVTQQESEEIDSSEEIEILIEKIEKAKGFDVQNVIRLSGDGLEVYLRIGESIQEAYKIFTECSAENPDPQDEEENENTISNANEEEEFDMDELITADVIDDNGKVKLAENDSESSENGKEKMDIE